MTPTTSSAPSTKTAIPKSSAPPRKRPPYIRAILIAIVLLVAIFFTLGYLNPSSTVLKIRLLALKDLRKDKSLLALHFQLGRYHWSSRKVGGIATPVARTACEASAVS